MYMANEKETGDLAARLAAIARPGDFIALAGDLGTGKTAFARAFINALAGTAEEVPSPTFTLIQSYDLGVLTVHHVDLYRLKSPEEALELGLDEALGDGLILMEWPERLGRYLPWDRLKVAMEFGTKETQRRVTLSGGGDWPERLKKAGLDDRASMTVTEPSAERTKAIESFLAAQGWPDARHGTLAADASFRRYERVIDADAGRRAVLMDARPDKENVHTFARVARHLRRLGFSAPEVLAEDQSNGFLLLEDFGDDTFTHLLAAGESEEELYGLAVDVLAALHALPEDDAAPEWLDAYDDEKLLEEASWFTDWYLPAVTGKETATETRDAYMAAWRAVLHILHAQPRTLVLRDYHVDNLLRIKGRDGIRACGLLDFQDAVAGPAAYDLVSLLEDARRDIGDDLVQTMQARYFGIMGDAIKDTNRESFMAAYAVLGVQRHAKVIGVFTRLSRRDDKDSYLCHIPRVWRLLERGLENPLLEPVKTWFDAYAPPELRRQPEKAEW